VTAMAGAIARGEVGGRLWFYANYHCNLRCTYCLTESAPEVTRRELGREQIVERAREGRELGFTALGVTGGEPFVLEYMPELIAALGSELPTIVLSNATVFNDRRLREMEPLADLPVQVQISLDRPDPDDNDAMRGPENFRKVVEAVPKLVERGIGVRIGFEQLEPELTLTADGAFYSPFAPTVRGGELDTDLLVSRTTKPVREPAEMLARIAGSRPAGNDASIGIR